MAVALSILLLLLVLALCSCHASACERCVLQGKAAYSPSTAGGGGGVCGYGGKAMETSGEFLAAGGPRQHRGGLGCGRCFQRRIAQCYMAAGKKLARCSTAGGGRNGATVARGGGGKAFARKMDGAMKFQRGKSIDFWWIAGKTEPPFLADGLKNLTRAKL